MKDKAMDYLLVASEYTEPSFFLDVVIERLNSQHRNNTGKLGLLLITKNIKEATPIYLKAQELEIPTVTHVTITGLGGTIVEPEVPNFTTSLENLHYFMTQVEENHQNVVLRIDPLIPNVTSPQHLKELIGIASSIEITRVRTSVIDFYPFVRDKFKLHNLPYSKTFNPPFRYDILLDLLKMCKASNMTLESCAESMNIPDLIQVGCADKNEWAKLGVDLITVLLGDESVSAMYSSMTFYHMKKPVDMVVYIATGEKIDETNNWGHLGLS